MPAARTRPTFRPRHLLRPVAGVLLAVAAGCATFEGGALPRLEGWPPPPVEAPPALSIAFDGLPAKYVAGWRRVAGEALADSGRATVAADAGTAGANPGGRIEFVVAHSRPPLNLTRGWMLVTALTAGLVPARAANCFDVEARFFGADGALRGRVQRSIESVTWVGWVMLLALPFAGAGMGGQVEDLLHSIVVEAVDRGLL